MPNLPGGSKGMSQAMPFRRPAGSARRSHTWFLSLALVAMMLNASSPGVAEDAHKAIQDPTEYQVKAAFLYNFAKFVEWPASVFPDPAEPILVGILGNNPFGDELERIFKSNTVGGRRMIVRRSGELQELRSCQILFISSSEKKRLTQLLEKLDHARVLTVSDMESFSRLGGIIGFTMEESKVRFQINVDAADRAGLRMSAKLLKVATVVRDSHPGEAR